MTVSEFTDFLVAECEAAGDADFVTELLDAAKTAILAGSGTIGSLSSGSLNGKNFTRDVQLSPAEVAKACRDALTTYNDTAGGGSITFLDFSRA